MIQSETLPSKSNNPLEVVVIGAGVSGLTLAYGLKDLKGVHLRVFEKRTGE